VTTTANPATASTPASGNNQFTYAQIEGIWLQAGGQPGAAPIAAAIAMAESGGNSTATHADSNGSVDRGLWQINSVHGAQSSYDVMTNARAAVSISNNGQNWTPWTTFNSGAYRNFIQTNVAPDTSAPINATNAAANQTANTGPLPGGLWDPANWFLNPSGTAAGAMEPVIKYLMQGLIITMLNPLIQIVAGVMGIGAGASMVFVGIWMMARQTQAGQTAERGAGAAAQTGAMFFAPEAAAATKYTSATGTTGTVISRRRPAGKISVGGRNIQYRPAQVSTEVQRPQQVPSQQAPPSTKNDLRNRANDFTNKKGPRAA